MKRHQENSRRAVRVTKKTLNNAMLRTNVRPLIIEEACSPDNSKNLEAMGREEGDLTTTK